MIIRLIVESLHYVLCKQESGNFSAAHTETLCNDCSDNVVRTLYDLRQSQVVQVSFFTLLH